VFLLGLLVLPLQLFALPQQLFNLEQQFDFLLLLEDQRSLLFAVEGELLLTASEHLNYSDERLIAQEQIARG
jgi:hypothetical protein